MRKRHGRTWIKEKKKRKKLENEAQTLEYGKKL
jgi:hypothetical protein